uniref:BTB domain-containing protein n=1 Tax=Cacopsylla melanoneura TaxID=428564 RepID=A0A8D8M5Y1_9HEMI
MAAYEFRNDKETSHKLELMLNNKERSDTVFLVNNTRYYAWSHLVAMNSTVLESLMNEYFAHCEDRQIKIRNVKHEESFYLVLQYMYGVTMNFTETNINIICEALCLAERFKMADFSKELKQFVSTKIDGFDIEVVVTLLNTSRKYNLDDVYKKVTDYAFRNAEHLVNHTSFVQLQYEVLVDLLKSDWFYAKEIEILRGVLTWHDDMDAKKREINADNTINGDNADEKDVDNESQSTTGEQNFEELTDTLSVNNAEQNDTLSVNNDKQTETLSVNNEELTDTLSVNNEEQTDTMSVNNEEHTDISRAGSSADPSCLLDENNTDNANLTPNRAEDLTNLVQSFKENVLKSLLSHIRHLRFTAFEYMKVLEADLFIKYRDILADYKHFSQSTEPRKQYVSPTIIASNPVVVQPLPAVLSYIQPFPTALYNKFYKINKVFTIKRLSLNTVYESEEELQIGNFKLKIDLKESSPLGTDSVYFDVNLKCTSDEERAWECYTEAQVIWKPYCNANFYGCTNYGCREGSHCKQYKRCWMYLPSDHKSFGQFSIFSSLRKVFLGQFNMSLKNLQYSTSYNGLIVNDTIELYVIIRTFQIKYK